MKKEDILKLITSIFGVQFAGILGSFFTITSIESWYDLLNKPSFQPPNWIFGPVWTTLYLLIGISVFLIWKQGTKSREVKNALAVFGIQLLLNALWSIVFFGLQSPFLGLIEITILWVFILWNIAVFYKISKLSAYLLIPYLLWVSFASYLNFTIWILN